MKLSDETLEQVKENRDLIESKDWLKIWETLKNPELNGAFVELGYNPLIGLKQIPFYYFYRSPMKSIKIPNSVTSIGEAAFYGCSLLANIVYRGSINEFKAIEKSKEWNYGVPATKVICNDGVVSLI